MIHVARRVSPPDSRGAAVPTRSVASAAISFVVSASVTSVFARFWVSAELVAGLALAERFTDRTGGRPRCDGGAVARRRARPCWPVLPGPRQSPWLKNIARIYIQVLSGTGRSVPGTRRGCASFSSCVRRAARADLAAAERIRSPVISVFSQPCIR